MDADAAGTADEGHSGQGAGEATRLGLANMSLKENESGEQGEEDDDDFCSVCYETIQYPIKLPCDHIFCFLCIKGAHASNRLCPMCRTRIPNSFILNPELRADAVLEKSKTTTIEKPEGGFKGVLKRTTRSMSRKQKSGFWMYESKRQFKTWWKYDERTSGQIEEAFQKWVKNPKKEDPFIDLQITGKIYRIDLQSREQYLQNGDGRRRFIKRSSDLAQEDTIVGTAGIKQLT